MRRIRLAVEHLEDRAVPTTVNLTTVADNTLYEDPAGLLSNGAGQHFFVGETAQSSGATRRGAIKFNLSSVPAGSIIVSATLTLHDSRSNNGAQSIALHRALQNWGEGNSNAGLGGIGSGEGDGVPAAINDVTWVYTFYNSQKWAQPGGNFSTTVSAATTVDAVGSYQWTGAGLLADVQAWVNHPSSNFGWILTGNESTRATAKQFDTRENSDPSTRPQLTVVYTAPAADLTVAVHHTGIFHPGDSADTYSITVKNLGAATDGTAVTVTDTLPAGLTPTAADTGSINGWNVSFTGQTVTATRTDVLSKGATYPTLTITASVAENIDRSVVNSVTVTGGGEVNTANDSASDPTATVALPDLTISQTRSGSFRQGDAADTLVLSVRNIGTGATVGGVTITDVLPAGLFATARDTGTINGWSVSVNGNTITATRSDVLAAGSTYPPLTLFVSVGTDAPTRVVNTVTVAGGGEIDLANDMKVLAIPILPKQQLQRRRGS
jgi:uncharacterized repeat protein (TIGR01451 family)